MSTPINIPDGSRWKHNESGNEYEILMVTNQKASKMGWPVTVVYRDINTGKVWSRPLAEWSLERYTPIPHPSSVPGVIYQRANSEGIPYWEDVSHEEYLEGKKDGAKVRVVTLGPAAPPERLDEALVTFLAKHTKLNQDGLDDKAMKLSLILNYAANNPVPDEEIKQWFENGYQPEPDYHKILLAYLNHVGECEGVSFLYSRGEPIKPLKGLTQEEMDELIRLDEQSND